MTERFTVKFLEGASTFWDKTEKTDSVVISTHGIIKKTNKTLQSEIVKAENLRQIYFAQKNQLK